MAAASLAAAALTACRGEPAAHREVAREVSPGAGAAPAAVPRVVRGNLTTELVPEPSPESKARIARYLEVRRADLAGWDAAGTGVFVLTRLANVPQLHRVDAPLGMRRQLTFGDEGVDQFVPTPDARRGGGIVVADEGGNENKQLYLLDGQGEQRLITDGKSRNEEVVWSDDGARIAFSSTRRNSRDFDLWTFDATHPEAAPVLVYEASGQWQSLDWSPAGDRLLALHEISVTRSELAVIEPGKGVLHEVKIPGVAEAAFADAVFAPGGAGIYYVGDHGGEFLALWYRDLATGQSRRVSPELKWDLEHVWASPDRQRLALTLNEGGWSKLMLFDTRSQRFVDVPSPHGIIRALDFSPDGRRLAVTLEGGKAVGDVHVIDLGKNSVTRWTDSETGGLDAGRFHEPRSIEYASFDGRKIPAFVYEPQGSGPHPVVISIHGGPEAQARPTFNALHEYLVSELGIAVILPNVRGSVGYGRTYTLADNAERREDSVRDIGGLLDWIAAEPRLDAKRVAVSGGSYGGFMSLASGAMFGERIAAVVDMVGISNFVSFLERTKEYRRDLRRVEYGDERVPAMRDFLERISPLTNSTKITAPLFVAQGANDPRVPESEAAQIVTKLRSEGREVWYMLAADEGHGFQKKVNRDAFTLASAAFFERQLLAGRPSAEAK